MGLIEIILTSVAGIITALGGVSLIKFLTLRKSEKKKSEIEAQDLALEMLRKQYEWLLQQNESMNKMIIELNKKVEDLQEEVRTLEQRNIDLIKAKADVELELKDAKHNMCLVPDDECFKRLPKRDECRLRNLIRGEYKKDHPDAVMDTVEE